MIEYIRVSTARVRITIPNAPPIIMIKAITPTAALNAPPETSPAKT